MRNCENCYYMRGVVPVTRSGRILYGLFTCKCTRGHFKYATNQTKDKEYNYGRGRSYKDWEYAEHCLDYTEWDSTPEGEVIKTICGSK